LLKNKYNDKVDFKEKKKIKKKGKKDWYVDDGTSTAFSISDAIETESREVAEGSIR